MLQSSGKLGVLRREEAVEVQSGGVRGDSALCLLQYACLTLSKPGLAPLALAALSFMWVPV